MEIIKINGYLDGGTIEIVTTNEIYYIDSRIGTKTRGSIFFGYPNDNNSNIASNQEEIKIEIKNALEKYTGLEFGNFDYKPSVYELLNVI
ncbi:MAG: hypothetical protein PF487_11705 [Bacteroidales bacterium]|jgi:hypothetical protein|nr:hypothetical protein [Bacteroidales bacterium]